MKLLLDTCTFLWLATEPQRISATAAEAINSQGNELFLSDVSVLEIVLKHSAGKLPLPSEPEEWVTRKVVFHQLSNLSLQQSDIYLSGKLPKIHLDPFDRLLVAQAICNGMTLLSPNVPMSKLGASQIW